MNVLDDPRLTDQRVCKLTTFSGPKPAPPIVVPEPDIPDFVDIPAPSPQDEPPAEPHDIPPPSSS